MSTRLTSQLFLTQTEIEDQFTEIINYFLNGEQHTLLQTVLDKITPLLNERWVPMDGGDVYCHEIKGIWKGLCQNDAEEEIEYVVFQSGTSVNDLKASYFDENSNKTHWALPTQKELVDSLTLISSAPFGLLDNRPSISNLSDFFLFQNDGVVQGFHCHKHVLSESTHGCFVPLFKLGQKDDFEWSKQAVLLDWLQHGFTPRALKEDADYIALEKQFYSFSFIFNKEEIAISSVKLTTTSEVVLPTGPFIKGLLSQDYIRADLKPYAPKMLDDIEQGHWDLWQSETEELQTEKIQVDLFDALVARDPATRIIDGTVGIDFGTKSTVVVCQKDSTHVIPMRIGTGDLSHAATSMHYENPTIMELNDLEAFIASYQSRAGRPLTKWQDLTVSHTAFSGLMNSCSADYNSYISELKQWAGTAGKRLKVIDKQGCVFDLAAFLDLAEGDINPIEIYAYYLGLYINNQNNGIYMNYILSFPVTYELGIRDKIIASFEKGIKKSLPQTLHNQPDVLSELSVVKGASEPAAYAIIALQSNEFSPEGDDKVFYGVFDFGGGTTDFDFGIYRESDGNNRKERRFDYVLEHFGAGGDRYLGGENLLALLAFNVFKANQSSLREEGIQFMLPPECREFPGSEMLLSESREAKMNMRTLIETLRPFWEADPDKAADFEKGQIAVNLTNDKGDTCASFELDLDADALREVIQNRIIKGIDNFFNDLRQAFSSKKAMLNEINEVHIFLAGNSSKAEVVQSTFKYAIDAESKKLGVEGIFTLYPPLDNGDDVEKPNGKTGVAFGLIETRKGGDILVLDHNMTIGEDIRFKYYLGESRKKKFKQVIGREQKYQVWVSFVDAYEEKFELYYSAQSQVSTNQVAIGDSAIKKKILKLDVTDEDASVYIRLVTPTQLEYVVALEGSIESNVYLGEIQSVNL